MKGSDLLPVSIPENITVHLGPPSSNAANITVPFADYVKNVASSEIYPTWPEAAIRANIYAQMSYVLNRIFTEWYRSQGYDFDITNSTRYDQSFVPGRDIFENISTIVDDMIGSYLTRGDAVEPLFAQYCNGTTVTCPGGLSQWGTVPLAEQGLSAEEIVRSFYGDDINFSADAPLSPSLGESFPGITLRLGENGEDVRTIQNRLNRISTNYPNIPKIYPADGVFDADTEAAVRAFQRQFNLTPDGLVGRATWYRIAFVYNNVMRLSELNSEGLTLEEISRQYPELLSEGMSGVSVRLLQYFLAIAGEYYDALPRWSAAQLDGIFGPQTRSAVEAYQRMLGLPVTGAVDPRDMERAGLYLPLRAARAARTGVARPVRRPARGIPRHRHARRRRAAGAGAHQHHRARLSRGARGRGGRHFRQRDRECGLGHPDAARSARDRRGRSADLGGDGAAGRRCRGVLPFCRRAVSRLRAQ